MQTAARSNLFLTEFSSLINVADIKTASKQAEFYQQFVYGLIKGVRTKQALIQAGNRLIALAEHFYQLRQMQVVEQVSQLLISLPLPREYESIANYYRALCIKRQGQTVEACALLERVADQAPIRYRARAMQSLGAVFIQSKNFEYAVPFCVEAIRAASHIEGFDLLTVIPAQQVIAIFKSIDGDHRGALTTLENLFPLIRALGVSQPPMYYAYLNSLAVEMAELGRLNEARYLSNIVLASPYSFAYPEWRETSDDIERKAYRSPRSFTSFNHRLLNTKNVVLYLYVPEPSDITNSEKYHRNPFQQGSITILEDWKRKMVKEPNGDKNDKDELKNASEKDLYLKLMELMAKRDLSSKQLHRVIDFVERISSEPDSDPKAD